MIGNQDDRDRSMVMVGVSIALPTAAAPALSTPRRDKRPMSVSDVFIAIPPSLLVELSDALGRPFLGSAKQATPSCKDDLPRRCADFCHGRDGG